MSASPNTSAAGGGLDAKTLILTAIASACAAYVTSEIWAPGTLATAAVTPVIVALVKEALDRPARAVTRAVPVRGVVRSAPSPGERQEPIRPVEPEGRVAQHGELPGRSRPSAPRAWRTAVVTGVLGFAIAAVAITVPEFVAGEAASGGGRQTTLFGGEERSPKPGATETTTQTAPQETQTAPPATTVTVAPAQTTTVPPQTATAAPPVATTPAPPAQTTPAPPAQQEPPP